MRKLTITSIPAAEFDLTLESKNWDMLAVKELGSETCYCGARKRSMQTFCRAEYYALPVEMRHALYDRIGAGYKEAYQSAREHLFNRSAAKGEA
jgi:hypothetical protein